MKRTVKMNSSHSNRKSIHNKMQYNLKVYQNNFPSFPKASTKMCIYFMYMYMRRARVTNFNLQTKRTSEKIAFQGCLKNF